MVCKKDAESPYAKKAQAMKEKQTRLMINVNDLRAYDENLTKAFLASPMAYLAPWTAALNDWLKVVLPQDKQATKSPYSLGFEGHLGGKHRLTPRDLVAEHVSSMIGLEGIVTKCSDVRPKVNTTVAYSEHEKSFKTTDYHDETSISGQPTGAIFPTKVCFLSLFYV